MNVKNKILTATLLGSTLLVVPTMVSAQDGNITADRANQTIETNNTDTALGVVTGTAGNLTLDPTFKISDNAAAGVQMNGVGKTFTIANNAGPGQVVSVTGTGQIGIDIKAGGGAGLLTIGKFSTVTSDTANAVKFSAGTNHAGITNSGTIDATGAIQNAISMTAAADNGTITNNATGVIQALNGNSAGINIGADVTANFINSGKIEARIGFEVPNNLAGGITNKNGGLIQGNAGGAILLSNGKSISLGITNEFGGTIKGVGGRAIDLAGTSNITNAGTITADTTVAVDVDKSSTITNSGTISGTGTARGLDITTSTNAEAINVNNTGTISSVADSAVKVTVNPSTGTFTNGIGGVITAAANKIAFEDTKGFTGGLINQGTITGGTAIEFAGANTTLITNTGSLVGAVNLGGGSLTNNQGGTISGNIAGLGGNTVTINAGTGSFTSGGTIDKIETVNFSGGTVNFNHTIGAVNASTTVAVNSGTLNLGADVKSTNFNNNGTGNVALTKSVALTGAFNQTSGNLTLTLVDKTNFGQLKVSGNLNMTNGGKITLDVPAATSKNILNGDVFDIVTVGGAVTSDAAVLVSPASPILTFAKGVGANGKDIRVTASRSVPATASVPGLGELNATLLNLMNSANIDPTLRSVLDQIEAMTNVADIQRAIRSLANDNSGGAQNASTLVGTRISALLSNRINVLRVANNDSDEFAQKGYAAGSGGVESGLWAQGFGMNTDQKLREGITGYDADTFGTTLGFDTHFGPCVVLGLAGTYANSKVKTKNGTGNNSRVKNYQGSLYGTLDLGGSFIDAMISYGNAKYKTVRNVTVGALAFRPLGNFNGKQFGARLAYSIPMAAGNFNFMPTVFANHNSSRQNAYSETNAGTVGLRVARQTNNILDVGLGASLSYAATTEHGGIIPSVEFNVHQDVVGKRLETTNTFIGGGLPFKLRGASVARTTADMGVGLNLIASENLNMLANYNVAFKNTYRAHAGTVTVRYAF